MNIMNMSAQNRRYMAYSYQAHMTRLTKEAIEHEERELEKFKDLQEQKAHYQGILDDNGYVHQGKFTFAGSNKTRGSIDEVQELLNAVQEKIDDIVTAKVAKESNPFDTKTFEYLYSGAMFLAASDMKSLSAVVVEDFSISGQWSRTEENYIEEAYTSIESLNQRFVDIDKIYKSFLKDGEFDERIANQTLEDKIKKSSALMNIFNTWNKKAMAKMLEFGDVDLEGLKKIFDKIVE